MRYTWLGLVLSILQSAPYLASETRADTARLADHLGRFRGHEFYELSATEYSSLQSEYFAWIDSRLQAGLSVKAMNEELKAARLLSKGRDMLHDESDRTFAGFLGEIRIEKLAMADDLLAIRTGIYTGGSCNFDESIVLYRRKPLQRIGWINAESSYTHGHHLSEIAIGKDDVTSGRIVASAWLVANCTSVWNGGRLRLDLLRSGSVGSVLNRNLSIKNDEHLHLAIEGRTATFRYTSSMSDMVFGERETIASYRLKNGLAVRQAPIATRYAGFIAEWLDLSDDEAARWSNPAAAAVHHEIAAIFHEKMFEWQSASACPGSPPVREIVIREETSKKAVAFQISGTSAISMRMVSVSDKPSPNCRAIDIREDLSSIMGKPGK